MAYEYDDAAALPVTREMLVAKIDELKSSAYQLEGHELGHAYRLISSISKKPYQFNINGPFQILPDRTDVDRTFLIVGPDPVLPPSLPSPPLGPPGRRRGGGVRVAPGSTTGASVDCPNCGHKLKIDLSL
jgi:hypothetical protein